MSLYCECGMTQGEVRRRVIKGGAVQFVDQCLSCGHPKSSPIRRTEVIRVHGTDQLPFFDQELLEAGKRKGREAQKEKASEEKEKFFDWYGQYLSSPEWKSKRQKVLERAGWLCEGCRSCRPTQVHHLTYEHVGNELLYELVALCDSCHDLAHDYKRPDR